MTSIVFHSLSQKFKPAVEKEKKKNNLRLNKQQKKMKVQFYFFVEKNKNSTFPGGNQNFSDEKI